MADEANLLGVMIPAGVQRAIQREPVRGRFLEFLAADFGGQGIIAGEGPGIVTVNGSPAVRPIRIYDRETGEIVARTQSAADGTYSVPGLSTARRYMVVVIDSAEVHNAAVQDMVTPELPDP